MHCSRCAVVIATFTKSSLTGPSLSLSRIKCHGSCSNLCPPVQITCVHAMYISWRYWKHCVSLCFKNAKRLKQKPPCIVMKNTNNSFASFEISFCSCWSRRLHSSSSIPHSMLIIGRISGRIPCPDRVLRLPLMSWGAVYGSFILIVCKSLEK